MQTVTKPSLETPIIGQCNLGLKSRFNVLRTQWMSLKNLLQIEPVEIGKILSIGVVSLVARLSE